MKVGLDLDEVLYPFCDQLETYCKWKEIEYEFDLTKYDFYAPKWDREHFTAVCKQATEESYLYFEGIYPDTRECMWELKNAGHSLHLVTNRFLAGGELDKLATLQWLDNYELPYDSLTITKDKTIVPVDIFLDDYIHNYDALRMNNTDAWLMNRPHNQIDDARNRVNTLSDFVNLVELKQIAKSIEL